MFFHVLYNLNQQTSHGNSQTHSWWVLKADDITPGIGHRQEHGVTGRRFWVSCSVPFWVHGSIPDLNISFSFTSKNCFFDLTQTHSNWLNIKLHFNYKIQTCWISQISQISTLMRSLCLYHHRTSFNFSIFWRLTNNFRLQSKRSWGLFAYSAGVGLRRDGMFSPWDCPSLQLHPALCNRNLEVLPDWVPGVTSPPHIW